MADEDTNQTDVIEETSEQEGASDASETTHIEEPTLEAPEEAAEAEDQTSETQDEAKAEEAPAQSEEDEVIETEEPAASGEDAELPEDKAAQEDAQTEEEAPTSESESTPAPENPAAAKGRWYVVHTFSGHENRVAATLRQRIESEHLEELIFDILVPTQDKIEIRGGKKETVKEKIFPGYILVKMILTDESWLAVRTTQGVTSFVGAGNKPTPITEAEVNSIVKFTSQGAQPTFKEVFMVDDTVKIIDGPFADFIGKVDSVDTEKGRLRVLVSIFGRETPVELDFLQVTKL